MSNDNLIELAKEAGFKIDRFDRITHYEFYVRGSEKEITKFASLIEAKQSARIAELEAQNKWISVKERLPDDCEEYLVTIKEDDGTLKIGITNLNPAKTGFYVGYDQVTNLPNEEVTHWKPKPLPAALKDEKC